jgi:phenylalanyl-tRNA synthetase beta chain
VLISHAWLTTLMDLPGPTPAPDELAAILTGLGLEVEGLHAHGGGTEAIVVGEILRVQAHPQASKLHVATLYDGARALQVVCGASNLPPPGGKVAFAPVGARLPGGLEIAPRELRGVASQGMICSETELELGSDGDGILLLPLDWAAGAPLHTLVPGVVDTVLEINITPNRPDALGHVGVARDVAAKLRGTLKFPVVRRHGGFASDLRDVRAVGEPRPVELVTIAAPERCGRYLGYVLEGATVAPSPLWLRVRLHRLGLRAISNVVDVTNLVLLEAGQPLHAFDRACLAEGRVVVRLAEAGETLKLLDGNQLELTPQDLVIADAARPQALAGVMGGAPSMVQAGTRELLLEAAWFAPAGIRASARRHGLNTDSSYRFERGVDHGAGLGRAALRALALLEELTGGVCTLQAEALGQRPPRPVIELRPERAGRLLGAPVPVAEAHAVLRSLEVAIDDDDPQRWRCTPPTHRPDLQREVDLIEELMRHRGLEHVPARACVPQEPRPSATQDPLSARIDRLADGLREAGLHEIVSLAFVAEDKLAPFLEDVPADRFVRVTNPMRGAGVMRTHLLPGLLDALAHNAARHGRPVRLFELGRTYAWPAAPRDPAAFPPGTRDADVRLPVERTRAGFLLHAGGKADVDPRLATGVAAQALARLGLRPDLSEGPAVAWLHPGVQVRLRVADAEVGVVGEVHPDVLARWGLAELGRAVYGEIDVDALAPAGVALYREVPRFPVTSRDVSLEVPRTLSAAAVVAALATAERAAERAGEDPPRLIDAGAGAIEVLDDYRGPGVPDDHRALLLRLHYAAGGRTVTDAEVQALHAAIVAHAVGELRRSAPTVRPR